MPQGIPKIQNFGSLKSEYLENSSKSARYMSIRVSALTQADSRRRHSPLISGVNHP